MASCNFSVTLLRSADKVGRPFCFRSVSYYFFLFSVFVVFLIKVCRLRRKTFLFLLCFLLFFIKVSDFSRKPFCFRFVFSLLFFFFIKVSDFSRKPFCFRLVFSLLFFFFIFLLSFQPHSLFITSSIFNRFTSNFQYTLIITR